MSLKQQKIDAIMKKYDGMITGLSDLTAGNSPSIIFFILADKLSYLLNTDAEIAISKKGGGAPPKNQSNYKSPWRTFFKKSAGF